MSENTKLAEMRATLKQLGFLDVSWTLDMGGMTPLRNCTHENILSPVGSEHRWTLCYDTNNGTGVVYDQEGRAWITRSYNKVGEACQALEELGITINRGAYVPHSNDGGNMAHFFLPERSEGRPKTYTVVVGLVTYVVERLIAAQILQLARYADQDKKYEEALRLKKVAAQVEERKLLPYDGMVAAVTDAK